MAPNAISIAQAYFHQEAWFRGIYADGMPMGFAMLEDWSQVEGVETELYEGEAYIGPWRFMIDAQHKNPVSVHKRYSCLSSTPRRVRV